MYIIPYIYASQLCSCTGHTLHTNLGTIYRPFVFTMSSIYTCILTLELEFHYRSLSIDPHSTLSILSFTFKFLHVEKPSMAVSFSKTSPPMWHVKGIRVIRIQYYIDVIHEILKVQLNKTYKFKVFMECERSSYS